jgi:D-alanyl-D-alanine carboxypeptidase (penicillin-binding protein 5/6)
MKENLDSVRIEVHLPDFTWGKVEQGAQYGSIIISIDSYILQEIPLVADRPLTKASYLSTLSDRILSKIFMMNK